MKQDTALKHLYDESRITEYKIGSVSKGVFLKKNQRSTCTPDAAATIENKRSCL